MRQNKMTSKYVPKWIPATMAIANTLPLLYLIVLVFIEPIFIFAFVVAIIPMIIGVNLLFFYWFAWFGKVQEPIYGWALSCIMNSLAFVMITCLLAVGFWGEQPTLILMCLGWIMAGAILSGIAWNKAAS